MDFSVHPRPPFRLDFTVFALRRNAVNAVDRWEAPVYRRLFVFDGRPVEVAVQQTAPCDTPELAVSLSGREAGRGFDEDVTELLRRVLGLDVDLTPFYRRVALDEQLAPLVERFKGLKPPVIPTVFETLLSAIACQQLSLIAGMHLLARLSEAYGMALDGHRAFPRPADLRRAQPSDLRAIGFSMRKSETILWLAEEIDAGRLDVEGLARLDTDEVIARLRALPGVGRWTAQYVALRALRRLDTFPTDDIGGQNKLQRLLDLPQRPDAEEAAGILDRWRPYQGLVYFYLLLESLS
jgi:DNA-3-methyladenine glycosylase II